MSEEWMSQRRHFRPGQTGRFIPHLTYGDLYGVQMRSDPPFDSTKTQVRDHKLRMRPKTDSDLVTQRFSARMQDATSLPFSTHDNRHGHEDTGSHFDTGLGRKKQSYGRRMHMSKGFKWSPPEEGLGRSVQKDDFVVRSKTEPINLTDQALRFRRYPKVYPAPRPKSSDSSTSLPALATAWNAGHATLPTSVMAQTQEPRPKPSQWKYSTHRYHN